MGRYFSPVKNEPALNSSSPVKRAPLFLVLVAIATLSGCGKSGDDIATTTSPSPSTSVETAKEMSLELISGQWKSGGKPARIEMVSNALVCTNEAESVSRAEIKDGKVLFATDWNTSATLSADGKELRWNNGTVWFR
jgi:hypothetical protein